MGSCPSGLTVEALPYPIIAPLHGLLSMAWAELLHGATLLWFQNRAENLCSAGLESEAWSAVFGDVMHRFSLPVKGRWGTLN